MWFSALRQTPAQPPRRAGFRPGLPAARRGLRLVFEQLEDRTVPSSCSAASVSDLIADINAANLAGGANTIVLVAGTTFTLIGAISTPHGLTGLPAIATNDNLTILGNGDIIERSAAAVWRFRLFDVAAGASLTLANMTLQGGVAYGSGVSAQGGAIYNAGTLDLNGVTVQNNTAQGMSRTSTLLSARPGEGGGIYSSGSLTLEGGNLMQNNQALGGNGGFGSAGANGLGGGVYLSGGTATLTDVTLLGNLAQGGHGGGLNDPGSIGQPGGPGGNGFGGGLYAAGGTITLRDDIVTGNAAQGGAGGLGSPTGKAGSAKGGGLYIDPLASLSLDPFTLQNMKNNQPRDIYGSLTRIS